MRGSAERDFERLVDRSIVLKRCQKLMPPLGTGWEVVVGAGGGGLRVDWGAKEGHKGFL